MSDGKHEFYRLNSDQLLKNQLLKTTDLVHNWYTGYAHLVAKMSTSTLCLLPIQLKSIYNGYEYPKYHKV